MTDNQMGGIALIAGAAGSIVTMALHPSGHDLFAPGQFARTAHLATGAHALAVASLPVSFLGALALSRRAAAPGRLGIAALVVYGFALAAAMQAAVVSGFVGPHLAGKVISAAPPASESWRLVFHYNGHVNQAFARVFVVASSAAIVLWSASIVRHRWLGEGIYGLLLGPAIIIAVVSGHLRLTVHGFGLIVLGQAVWFIIVGTQLWRLKEK